MTDWNLNFNFLPFNRNCDKRVTALSAVNPAASTCKLEMFAGLGGLSLARSSLGQSLCDSTQLAVINIVK